MEFVAGILKIRARGEGQGLRGKIAGFRVTPGMTGRGYGAGLSGAG